MKHPLFVTALLVLGAWSSATAQTNALKVNLLSPLVRTASLFYEHKFGPATSGQVGGYYTGWKSGTEHVKGFGITPEFRYYLSESKEAIEGFYLGPYLRFQQLTLTQDRGLFLDYNPQTGGYNSYQYTAKLTTIGGGLLIGHQWLFRKHVTVDSFLGPGYNGGKLRVSYGHSEDFTDGFTGFLGFTLRAGVSLGVAF